MRRAGNYDPIPAMLAPEAGKFLVDYFHANRGTYEAVDPAVLESLGVLDPEAPFNAISIEPEAEEPSRSKYIQLVTEVKAGMN